MFKHPKLSRLSLLLRIWWLERTQAILEDQAARVHTALRETDRELNAQYARLRSTLPHSSLPLPLEFPHD